MKNKKIFLRGTYFGKGFNPGGEGTFGAGTYGYFWEMGKNGLGDLTPLKLNFLYHITIVLLEFGVFTGYHRGTPQFFWTPNFFCVKKMKIGGCIFSQPHGWGIRITH